MGLAELFLGQQNPFAQWAGANRNALGAIGAGIAAGPDFGTGLGNAARMLPEGRRADDAFATTQKAEAERQQQLNMTTEWLRSQAATDGRFLPLLQGVEAGALPVADAFKVGLDYLNGGAGVGAPANVREWEYYNGLSPEDQSAYLRMKRANPYLDVGTGFVQPDPVNPGMTMGPAIVKNGDVPTGFQQIGGGAIAPMPGSEQDMEATGRRVKADSAMATLEQKNAVALQAVDAALSQANWLNTGNVMGNSGWVPVLGQGATDLARTLDTIKANIGFEELQTMRDNSPTGGALGQVTERELAFLQSTIASIEQAQSEDQLKRNLKTLRDFIAQSQARRRAAFEQQYGGGQSAGGGRVAPGGQTSTGLLWSVE